MNALRDFFDATASTIKGSRPWRALVLTGRILTLIVVGLVLMVVLAAVMAFGLAVLVPAVVCLVLILIFALLLAWAVDRA